MQASSPLIAAPSLTVVLITVWMAGCARWSDNAGPTELKLPPVSENTRAVVLHVEFLPLAIDRQDVDQDASLWQWIDETAIDASTRGRLIDNGLRVGRVINIERFRLRAESLRPSQGVVDQFLSNASVASEVSHNDQRIPMRLGRRYELPLHQPIEGERVTMVRVGDETIGRTLHDPQYLFAVTAEAGKQAGEIQLRFRPEVQHGEMKHEWVSSDTALRIDARRETWSIDRLDVNVRAVEGDTLVIAATHPPIGLAAEMLVGKTPDQANQQILVLIRVDQIPTPAERL